MALVASSLRVYWETPFPDLWKEYRKLEIYSHLALSSGLTTLAMPCSEALMDSPTVKTFQKPPPTGTVQRSPESAVQSAVMVELL